MTVRRGHEVVGSTDLCDTVAQPAVSHLMMTIHPPGTGDAHISDATPVAVMTVTIQAAVTIQMIAVRLMTITATDPVYVAMVTEVLTDQVAVQLKHAKLESGNCP